MILYQLRCSSGHEFEGWFRNAAAFDEQAQRKGLPGTEVACPVCGDITVTKAPMAPHIGMGREEQAREERTRREKEAALAAKIAEVRRAVEESCDYVGDTFPEEARKIHYGEADPRSIYGEASEAEAEALNEEGITFNRIPWLPRTHS